MICVCSSCGRCLVRCLVSECFPCGVMQSICVFCGCMQRLHACSMIVKIAYVCRSVRMRLAVAMARSSQYALMIASWGDMEVAISRIMGSKASAKRVIESGQPCFTPEVKVSWLCSVPFKKMVCVLLLYRRSMALM